MTARTGIACPCCGEKLSLDGTPMCMAADCSWPDSDARRTPCYIHRLPEPRRSATIERLRREAEEAKKNEDIWTAGSTGDGDSDE